MAGKNTPEKGLNFPEELMSGEFDIDEICKALENPTNSETEKFIIATKAFGILKRRSERLTSKGKAKGLSDTEIANSQRDLDEKMAEVQKILAQGSTRRAPKPTDETVRVIAPDQDTKIQSVDSVLKCDKVADDDEETLVFQREQLVKDILGQGEQPKTYASKPAIQDSATKLISVIEAKDPLKPQTSGVQEVFALALGDKTVDSTVRIMARQMVEGIATSETSPISNTTDIFDAEPTQVENRFSRTCNVVSNLGFLDFENSEDFFRGFLNVCQERPKGREELLSVFESLKEALGEASAEKHDVFFALLVKVTEKPGRDIGLAQMAMKGSDIGTWKNGVAEVLEQFIQNVRRPSVSEIVQIPTMDISHAIEEALKNRNYKEKLAELLNHFYKNGDKNYLFEELQKWIIKLEKDNKYEIKDLIIDNLENIDLEFAYKIEMALNKLKLAENKKIIQFPVKQKPEEKAPTLEQEVVIDHVVEEKEKKEKGVLIAFINKYRGRLLMASGLAAILGVVGVSAYNYKKDEKGKEAENIKVYNLDPSKIIEGGVTGGIAGVPMDQVVSFDGIDSFIISASNGAVNGIAQAKQENEENLVASIEKAKEQVAMAEVQADEEASKKAPEAPKEWAHKVEAGDNFFGIVEEWKANYGFGEMQKKYSFLNGLDNWELAAALRMIFNENNGRNRDFDVYKGSDKDIADTFTGTPYEVFMQVFKFKHRAQRNMVVKFMQDGGNFEDILATIDKGDLQIEMKAKFIQKMDSMKKKYEKRKAKSGKVVAEDKTIDQKIFDMVWVEEFFTFKSKETKKFVMDAIGDGKAKLGNVLQWIENGNSDAVDGVVSQITAERKKTAERKTYKLDTGHGVIKGKKAIEEYQKGLAQAKLNREIAENLKNSEDGWAEIAETMDNEDRKAEQNKCTDFMARVNASIKKATEIDEDLLDTEYIGLEKIEDGDDFLDLNDLEIEMIEEDIQEISLMTAEEVLEVMEG